MEALQLYASDSDSSDSDTLLEDSRKKAKLINVTDDKVAVDKTMDAVSKSKINHSQSTEAADSCCLPPPPPDLLTSSNSSSTLQLSELHAGRIRSFPHADGNYALHVYIPVRMPAIARRQLGPLMKKTYSAAPELKPMEMELTNFPAGHSSYETKLAQDYHISLSRTVPIRVHQINSIVAMLQNKFEHQKGFWLELDKWELFVNDEETRSFLSLEAVGKGLLEFGKMIQAVDDVFQLHNLPVYYKTPRPHVSVAWALGKAIPSLQKAMEDLKKNDLQRCGLPLWSQLVKQVECKIGSKTYCIWNEKLQTKS